MNYSIFIFVSLMVVNTVWGDEYKAELTAYCPCVKCCGSFPGKIHKQTASGKIARSSHTLAMPKGFEFGTIVYTKELGVIGICEDRGGAIQVERGIVRIDIYFDTHKEALKFGRKKNITIFTRKKDGK